MRFEVGAALGRYTIEALLGEGGMGEVYRAYDTLLRRKVALKILRAGAGDGATESGRAVARILREARVAAALHHPNAVSIFDLGEHEGVHFLAMELVSGRSLREFVGRSEVPLEQRARWLADIARALDAAHKASIVHLDIKPENILVRADAVVKVLDFGIARSFVFDHDPLAPPPATANTQASTLAGTPRYMAPEQVQRRELDGRTDQFSWGVVAYELLAGAPPWGANQSLFDTFFAIAHEAPSSLRGKNPEVPAALEAVVMRALAKAPEKRFASMGALVLALEHVFPQLAPTPSWMPEARPFAGAPMETTKPDTRAGEQTVSDTAADLPRATAELDSRDPAPDAKAATTTTLEVLHAPPSERPESAPETKGSAVNAQGKGITDAPRAEARRGLLRRVTLGALLLGALSVAGIGGRALLAPRAAIPTPAASASAGPAATAITDLPPPIGCTAAATTSIRAGLQAHRDGNWDAAHVSFERAVKEDPGCAAAHLRLTLTGHFHYPPSEVREIYQRAVELRESLSERDRGLLDALDPLVRSDPSDQRGFAARLAALAERLPGDAELAYLSGEHTADHAVRLSQGRAAIAIDPHYSDGFQLIANTLGRQRKMDDALATLDTCIRVAPNSVDCIQERVDVVHVMGRCDEMVSNARLWIARAPTSPSGYLALARGLAAQGGAADAIEEALRQRWARLPEAKRAQKQPIEQALLDALGGRFDRVAARAREAAEVVEREPNYEPHVGPTLLLVEAALETEQLAAAGAIAADFLGRKDAWASSIVPNSFELKTYHLTPLLLDVERASKKLTEREWQAARATWATSAKQILGENTIWAVGVAMPVRTPAEAKDALLSMPAALRNTRGEFHSSVSPATAFVGRALLLAGEVDEAILFLRRAVGFCAALDIPFEHTQASLWLGQALEKKGDAEGACAAYRVVERRWGSATPASVTFAIASKRMQTLRCER